MGSTCSVGTESILQDKKGTEMYKVNIINTTELYTKKMVKMVNFMSCFLPLPFLFLFLNSIRPQLNICTESRKCRWEEQVFCSLLPFAVLHNRCISFSSGKMRRKLERSSIPAFKLWEPDHFFQFKLKMATLPDNKQIHLSS